MGAVDEAIEKQYEVFLRVAAEIEGIDGLQEKLDRIAEGIVEAGTYRRALISLLDDSWNVVRIGSAGLDPADVERMRKRPPLTPDERRRLLDERCRMGASFFIPHDDQMGREVLKGAIPSRLGAADFVDWHPDDMLFVPLFGREKKIIGTLSVDDPFDGRRPTPESIRVLELFAREAAVCIETSLLNAEVLRTRAYLETLIDGSPDAIITTDTDGRIALFNGGASRLLGYRAEEVIGRSVVLLYSSLEEARRVRFGLEAKRAEGETGRVSNYECLLRAKWGEKIPVSLSASILYDADGEELGTAGISKDLRPLRKLEQELIKAEKIATLGEVGAMLSHDVNNFLASILSACELSCRFYQDPEVMEVLKSKGFKREVDKEKYRLRVIQEEALRIGQITEKLQLMAKGKEYETKPYLDGVSMLDIDRSLQKILESKTVRILVADDQLHVRKFLREVLEDDGFTVEDAEDGEEVISKVRGRAYDLVISDIRMPKKTGNEVVGELKSIAPALPVILMTAYGYDPSHIAIRARKEGVVEVLYKPFDLRKLKEAISRALSEKRV
ncbi:MAG: response regulator [Candidatus Latescibacterota bacterium]|nr:MAG: response regulator [Candidatus Latescibacterota bacterium]